MQINPALINAQMTQMQLARLSPQQRAMTVGNMATPFGACNFFDRCSDGLMSLHYGASLPLLDWMGFRVDDEYKKELQFITYVRPEYATGNPTTGALGDPCADPNGVEFGKSELTIEDFGRYGRKGPTREMIKPRYYCQTDPRYRLDGTPVTSEREWDLAFVTDVLLQDISRDIITGNATNAGEMDGFERIVKTGYNSPMLDSIVVDWNNNTMSGGTGVTWNGTAVTDNTDFVRLLHGIIRHIRQRVSWAPQLRTQTMNLGDMILLMPHTWAEELLDFFTCWTVCPGQQYNETNLGTYEARNFRNNLLGGLYGYGYITIDNVTLPIMAYDYELVKGPTTADIYLLTSAVGNVRIWEGQHLDAAAAARQFGTEGMFSMDGGRLLGRVDSENLCYETKLWMHPRVWCRAPWMQVRIQNVKSSQIRPILSGDPLATSYFPVTSFGAEAAVCP